MGDYDLLISEVLKNNALDVSEMIVYDRALTQGEIREVIEYLAWNWAPERSQVNMWTVM